MSTRTQDTGIPEATPDIALDIGCGNARSRGSDSLAAPRSDLHRSTRCRPAKAAARRCASSDGMNIDGKDRRRPRHASVGSAD